jgi:hypothetical protein
MKLQRDAPQHRGIAVEFPTTTGESMIIFKTHYGEFSLEQGGRLSGHTMEITGKRKDGKYMVTHAFGSGKRIRKVYTTEQLILEIAKLEPQYAESLI